MGILGLRGIVLKNFDVCNILVKAISLGNTLEGIRRLKNTLNHKVMVTMRHVHCCSMMMTHRVYKSIPGYCAGVLVHFVNNSLLSWPCSVTVKILAASPNVWPFFVASFLLTPNCNKLYCPCNSFPWPALLNIPPNRHFIPPFIYCWRCGGKKKQTQLLCF